MSHKEYTEKDWELFKEKIGDWQEAYMEKLVKEYIELLSSDQKASEKFWELDKRIKEHKKNAGVMVDMRRSKVVENVALLLCEGAITKDDLNGFTSIFKNTLRSWLSPYMDI